jgi:hypothetical protein
MHRQLLVFATCIFTPIFALAQEPARATIDGPMGSFTSERPQDYRTQYGRPTVVYCFKNARMAVIDLGGQFYALNGNTREVAAASSIRLLRGRERVIDGFVSGHPERRTLNEIAQPALALCGWGS